jgi:site-specific DNA recombinase
MKHEHKLRQGTAVIYLRTATVPPAGQADPIDVQRQACQHEAERRGVRVVAEFVDRGKSGNNPKRRGLQQLLHCLARRDINYVIVRDLARLSRRPADYYAIEQAVEQAGTTVLTADDANGRLELHRTLHSEARPGAAA